MKPIYDLKGRMVVKADVYVDNIEDHIAQLRRATKVYEEAAERFLYAVAQVVAEILKDRGSGAEGVDYSNLEFYEAGKIDGYNTLALVHPDLTRELGPADEQSTVVYISPKRTNDTTLEMLARNSPWPVEALPGPIPPADATSISRRVTQAEIIANVDRLLGEQEALDYLIDNRIVSKTKDNDGRRKEVLDRALPPGWEVTEDIAWRVLRQEFGLGGESSIVHWRPAIKGASEEVLEECENFVRYLMGDEDALKKTKFDGSGLSSTDQARIEWFQQNLGHIGKASRAGEVPT